MRDWNINFDLPLGGGFSINIDWIPSDTEQNFIDNFKLFSDSTHLKNYKNNPIIYSLNNYGFRTPDDFFDGDSGTVYLGCSHTFGTGHYLENSWAYNLHQKVGEGKFFNLSCGSIGITSQYAFLKYFSKKLKIKKVFHYYPDECFHRYEFLDKDGNTHIVTPMTDDKCVSLFFQKYLSHKPYNSLHNLSYIDAIKNICKENECEYHIYTKSYTSESIDAYSTQKTPARDLLHYYVEDHTDISNNFLKML